jgi:hypothetical protein
MATFVYAMHLPIPHIHSPFNGESQHRNRPLRKTGNIDLSSEIEDLSLQTTIIFFVTTNTQPWINISTTTAKEFSNSQVAFQVQI